MDLDDRVVDIDQGVLIHTRCQRRLLGQAEQEPRRDRVQLPDLPKSERPKERPSVEGAYAESNTMPMPPCRSKAMSSRLSAPTVIPATSENTFTG